MASRAYGANAFANSFIQGYSFIDNIKANKRAEARLEQRLAEEREARAFQRKRQLEQDRFRREDRATAAEDRERALADRQKREEGIRLSLDPNASEEQLAALAPFSPEAYAVLKQRAEMDKNVAAAREIQKLNQAGQAGLTQSQGNQGLSAAVAQTTQGQAAAGAAPAPQPGALVGSTPTGRNSGTIDRAPANPDIGTFREPQTAADQFVEVDESDVSFFDPRYQNRNALGKAADILVGDATQVGQAVENFGGRIAGGIEGAANATLRAVGINPPPEGDIFPVADSKSNAPRARPLAGTLLMPSEFVSPNSPEWLEASSQERAEIRKNNERIIADQRRLAESPSNFKITPNTRLGALQEAGEIGRDEAIRYENQVINTYEDWVGPEGGKLEELALQDPAAAATKYLADRATLEQLRPDMVTAADRRMVPVFEATKAQIAQDLAKYSPGSPQHRQAAQKYQNLQDSINVIARKQPKVAQEGGVQGGFPVGNKKVADNVTSVMFDPDRPMPDRETPGRINAAATVAGNIKPGRRLTDNQIEALYTLSNAGWLDKSTAQYVLLNGQFPPGQDPKGYKSHFKQGKDVYIVTNDGSIVPMASTQQGRVPSREIGEDVLGSVKKGLLMSNPNMQESDINSALGVVAQNASFVRQHFNVTSEEQMMKLGMILHQNKILAAKEFKSRDDAWFETTKNSSTAADLFTDPAMRQALAIEHEIDIISMPEAIRPEDVDVELVRQAYRDGEMGPIGVQYESQMTDEQIIEAYVKDAYPRDLARQAEQ